MNASWMFFSFKNCDLQYVAMRSKQYLIFDASAVCVCIFWKSKFSIEFYNKIWVNFVE